jgi:carbon storage regulator
MLILTPRVGETLSVGDDIQVTVLTVSGNPIRPGVTAPREVPVQREEVAEQIRLETEQADSE